MIWLFLDAVYFFGMGLVIMHGLKGNSAPRQGDDPAEIYIWHFMNLLMGILWPLLLIVSILLMIKTEAGKWAK
ncbi:MAG: hypothetical protein RIC30_09525 [Marinoscillum sp.]|uniref:hypothetical protein n=1 Tax=Marinoscillum sp. TaxID=2024838 RepID=UPI0032F18329